MCCVVLETSVLTLLQKRPPSLENVPSSKEHPLPSDERLNGSSENDPTDDDDKALVGETILSKAAIGQPECGKARRPPTGAEVTAIKAAQELFLSSSFKLQVHLRVLFVLRVSSLLGYHRSMLSYQTFDQKIHENHH